MIKQVGSFYVVRPDSIDDRPQPNLKGWWAVCTVCGQDMYANTELDLARRMAEEFIRHAEDRYVRRDFVLGNEVIK